jgi:hypothetical protein
VLLASYLVTPQQIAAAGAQFSEKPPTRASVCVQDPSDVVLSLKLKVKS